MIDLHVHSCFSDGTDTPEELAAHARRIGLRALALTDHDNTAGVARFLAACRAGNLTGLAGVELSAAVPSGSLHLVGLGIDPGCAALQEALEQVQEGRGGRNQRILGKLRQLGFDLDWAEVARQAGDETVGRPHFAQAMVARGWAASVQEVFDRFLAKGAPAYVDRFRMTPVEAIRLIRAAGGVAILAHPLTWSPDPIQLDRGVGELIASGLAGIEAYYPSHSTEETVALLRLAARHHLLVSGGTDYHGRAVKPDIELGSGNGTFEVPDAPLVPLFAALGPAGHYHRERVA
jgi:predicted metal-dependent phosphoesterase TrpH